MLSSRSHTVTVDGISLTVPRGVLDPVLFRSGAWAAQQIAARLTPGQRLLDLGCGSGVIGALAMRAGAEVVAVDIDRRAVKAARSNGLLDVRHGDLFAPVAEDRFDVIAFNPPYFPGRPHLKRHGRALYGGRRLEVMRRFAEQLPAHISPGGQALVVLSDRAPHALAALGNGWEEATSGSVTDALGTETLTLYSWKTLPR